MGWESPLHACQDVLLCMAQLTAPTARGLESGDSHVASPHLGTSPGCSTGLQRARGGSMAQHQADPSTTPTSALTPAPHRPQNHTSPISRLTPAPSTLLNRPSRSGVQTAPRELGGREMDTTQDPYGCPPPDPVPCCVTQQGCSRMGTGSSTPQFADRGTGPREEEPVWRGWHRELKAGPRGHCSGLQRSSAAPIRSKGSAAPPAPARRAAAPSLRPH